MKFGIAFDPHIDRWETIKFAEELGYHRAWVPDSQMLYSDCYAVLALAAAHTRNIRIGPGMTSPATRTAPVTANAIATINKLAPGRTFLGIATGHTSMQLLGHHPTKLAELREYIRVVRGLLHGDEVDFTFRGKTTRIQFMHRERRYINIDDSIPIFVAAYGPNALALAGEVGDGWVTTGGVTPEAAAKQLSTLHAGAQHAGRTLPADFVAANSISACVLRPGEKLTDERVVNHTGAIVTTNLHFVYDLWVLNERNDAVVPQHFADIWLDYIKRVEGYSLPPETRFRQIHHGHAAFFQEEERRFITSAGIRAACVVGEPDEIVEQLRKFERAGLNEINVFAPADYQRETLREFAEAIMPHFASD